MKTYPERANAYKDQIEAYLEACFADDAIAQKTLLEAMRYSLLAGGKRIRPVLCMEFCRVCGGNPADAMPFAAAMEMIHTYSLIHDDLPCMDNDDFRRGKPTCHKAFGEANAVLAGDALLTAAFAYAASAPCEPALTVAAVQELAHVAGAYGMVGGQVIDLTEGERNVEELAYLHTLKTGALIRGACRIGVLAGHGTPEQLDAATTFAAEIGLAFQILDDILDVTGNLEKLGKKTGMDENKTTFVTLLGVERCQALVSEHTNRAIAALDAFEDAETLRELALFLAGRDY